MKKKRDIFEEIENFMKRLTWLIVATLGFAVFAIMAFKHFLDYWKMLW